MDYIILLQAKEIKYFGAGMNSQEASKPLILKHNNITIGFLGYCTNSTGYGYLPVAGINNPGINNLETTNYISQIKNTKRKCDYLFMLIHWGNEHTFFPPYMCKKIAYEMIQSGADGIIGSHPHRIQSKIIYKNKPIFFSILALKKTEQ
ncbi:MAG: hypothetical protein GX997_08015 [Bacteroidales bacterium]|nr:hypothetical protein [Bacteroidales bacterium]